MEAKVDVLEQALDAIRSRGGEVAWVRFAEEESEWFTLLGQRGGVCCGTDLRLTRPLEGIALDKDANPGVRPARPEDLETLERIAERGHGHSHFFRDPFLDEEKKKALFPGYVRESVGLKSRSLWVAEEGNEILGFALLIEPANQMESIGRRVGILDFIVVDPAAQGRGVGKTLLRASHRRFAEKGYEYVELRTMLDNRQAINFYQREGYRLVSSEVHFSLGLGGS